MNNDERPVLKTKKPLTLTQALRRLGQQMDGWSKEYEKLNWQLPLAKKLYLNHGLELVNTCFACPEQYDVFLAGTETPAGYLRLRHGEFSVDYPDCGGETIFEAAPNGDGVFDVDERLIYLTKAMKAILKQINLP